MSSRTPTSTMYHSMVLEFRRRAARGCSTSGSYVFGHGDESRYLSKRIDPIMVRNDGTVGDITHAFKFGAIYGLPFGRGERFGGNVNGVVDRIIGGWQFAGSARVSSGRLLDLGNVRLVGMDQDDLQEHVQAADQRGGTGVHVPAGDHRRVVQGVQRQRDVGERLRQPRRAERPLHRAG